MKPALFYTLLREPYGERLFVYAATTEKGRRVWGRDHFGNATNWTTHQALGRFKTQEQAEACIVKCEAIKAQLKRDLVPLNRRIGELHDKARADIEAVVAEVEAGA